LWLINLSYNQQVEINLSRLSSWIWSPVSPLTRKPDSILWKCNINGWFIHVLVSILKLRLNSLSPIWTRSPVFPLIFSRGLNVWLQALATRVHWYQQSTSNTKRKGKNFLFHFAVSWRECTTPHNKNLWILAFSKFNPAIHYHIYQMKSVEV
jgi:hypothetical protein